MIELPRLTAEALIVLAGAVIYLGGIGLWFTAQYFSLGDGGHATEEDQAQTLSRLSHHCRIEFVRKGWEAELREISEHVQNAEPPMPECPREDIDIHFYNRAN
jgi:hypothetical protein